MVSYVRKSLNGKLVLFFLAVSLVPIAVVGHLSFSSARATLEESVLDDLGTAMKSGKTTLLIYLEEAVDLLQVLAVTEVVERGAGELTASPSGNESGATGISEKRSAREGLHTFFGRFLKIHRSEEGFKDVLIIGPRGDVVFSQKGLSDNSHQCGDRPPQGQRAGCDVAKSRQDRQTVCVRSFTV